MKKIPMIFTRNPENMNEVLEEKNPVCEWVFRGEGVATRKYDGSCCMVKGWVLYKRRMVKPGKKVPTEFIQEDFDENTGKTFGWVPVDPVSKQDKYHREAFNELGGATDGTYELVGPKFQGNPEGISFHVLVSHNDSEAYLDCPRTFEGIKDWLSDKDIEGIVFCHPDGRMAKIRKSDFGMDRKLRAQEKRRIEAGGVINDVYIVY